ncbi:uncharacterized protein LOC134539706 [Bacillus rossius redtenbacheri]|uniref:uncharacterized protein LOC134539706 n=1 Tax=Bacillus rossius redtenbacheri TaxID=93214 RepID=UPI002FDDDF1D
MLSSFLEKFSRKGTTVVNCWFCNKDTLVPFGNKNCFDCPSCDQYNGFTRDGSYNKVIPAQRNELLNHPVAAANQAPGTGALGPKAGGSLCPECNSAQQEKVNKLAAFSPSKPSRYDVEIEEYRWQLERRYPLCWHCEKVVQQVLLRQKSTLLGLKNKLCGNKVSVGPPRPRGRWFPGVIPLALATWLVLASAFGDEEPFLPWPFQGAWRVLPPAVLRAVAHSEALLTLAAVLAQAALFVRGGAATLEGVGCLVLFLQLHALCWLRPWFSADLQYHAVQVVTCVVILSVKLLRQLQSRRKKRLLYGSKSDQVTNLQWHRITSTAAAVKSESKRGRESPPREMERRKHHVEAEPSVLHSHASKESDASSTPYEDLRVGLRNLQLGFTSTARENTPATIFKTREYGTNVDRHLFRGANVHTWSHAEDRHQFARYRGKIPATSWPRCPPELRRTGGKWSEWRDSYEPLSLVEKPYASHSRSPSRSSGYGSLASRSSGTAPDHAGRGLSPPRWDCLGRTPTPETASSWDVTGRLVSAQSVYLGPPYVYYVFPHVLYPSPHAVPAPPPVWGVQTYPHASGAARWGRDTGGGYLLCCEIAAYVGAALFLAYSVFYGKHVLLLEGS